MRMVFAGALGLLVACTQSAPAGRADAGAHPAAGAATRDGGADGSAPASSAESKRDAGPPAEFLGVVRGTVKLAPGVELPIAPPPTSHGQPPPSVAPCPPVDRSDQRTVAQAPGGGLSPVHLALTGMSAAPPREPRTHELFIDACRLRPTLLGAMRGDTLRITNRSDTALLPALPGDSFMRGLLRGETREVVLKQTQTRVGCSFGSYCGESLIVATTHPFYAVTDGEGHFTIENLPLDQELRLHAWHPLFKVASAQFRLSHDQREKSVELALEPRENAAASSKEQGRAARPGRAKPGAKKAPAMPEPLPRGPAYE